MNCREIIIVIYTTYRTLEKFEVKTCSIDRRKEESACRF